MSREKKPNIEIKGNVTGAKIDIGGSEEFHGNVTIHYTPLPTSTENPSIGELKTLLQELESALKQEPAEKADEVEAIQNLANQAVAEVAKEKPNKAILKITRNGLIAAAENLLTVSPIVAKIAKNLLTGWLS